eukprot:gnl/MRDRNA2_/MRDRNA2_149898_c0_seq1.p1 gnl/MRDRNA2_/MRDRNA2_149898_c0~~gnl/MRDRNA2_/MRDRNA2_149898_c0_seq1.p1  ORF type:complete len:146 (-),score=25.03 gnl/MRDRNA2_/MRDRNA2_149898_c0_seq1:17-454(-)
MLRRVFSSRWMSSRQYLPIFGFPVSCPVNYGIQPWMTPVKRFSDQGPLKNILVMRKKMQHQARSRMDPLVADFLLAFAQTRGNSLEMADLEAWQDLMALDDVALQHALMSNIEEVPEEMKTEMLTGLREYLEATGPRNPFSTKRQ